MLFTKSNLSNVFFIIELIVAQGVLIYSFPRRKKFILRAILSFGGCLLLAYLFPMPQSLVYNTFYGLLRFLLLLCYTVGAMTMCFRCKFPAIVAACVGGYAIQHIGYQIYTMLCLIPAVQSGNWWEFACCAVLSVAMFFTLGRYLAKTSYYKNYNTSIVCVSVLIIVICIGLSRLRRMVWGLSALGTVCFALYAITCCALALTLLFVLYGLIETKATNNALIRIREEEKKQYEISKTNMELLNIRYHDLKQRLSNASLPKEQTSEMKELLDMYDSTPRTGLDVLDIILNEKIQQFRKQDIDFTFLGDGSGLAFMKIMDIYSLFGNILTNAYESVIRLTDRHRKSITLTIERKGDFIYINESNYFEGQLTFEDGLPQTTKSEESGYHGFGMKSIRNTVRKYGGDVSVQASEGIFALNLYLVDDTK